MKDNITTIADLKKDVKKFCEDRNWDQFHSPKDLAIGISIESAELLEFFRFKSDQECAELLENTNKRQEIGEEISDILFMLLRFVQKNRFELSEIFDRKLEITKIKYPIEKAKNSNKKYNEE